MRIAYVGNFEPAHSTENEVRKAAVANGHDVLVVQEQHADWARLPSVVADHSCDLLLWTRTADLDGDPADVKLAALDQLAEAGIPTVAFHLDRWWGLAREHQVAEEPFFRCSVVVTADGGHDDRWADVGVNHHWLPPGVSEFECVPGQARPEYTSDLAFVGSWQHYHREWRHRKALVTHLQRRWRRRVRFWPTPNHHAIRGEALRDLYASVNIAVGDSCLTGAATRYWSDRIPETIGRGGFLLHPHVAGLDDHFAPGEHLACWTLGDFRELDQIIERYLDDPNERHRVTEAGRAHVLEHHTYTVRVRQILDLAGVPA